MTRALLVAGAGLLAAGAHATGWQAELGAGHESLDGGRPAWRQLDAALRHRSDARALLELNARATERFERRDRELGLAAAVPLAERWHGSLAATASPTHHILPRWSIGGELQRELAQGWLAGAGLKRTRYDLQPADALSLGVERYFGDRTIGEWRAAATWVHTRLHAGGGAPTASSDAGRLRLDRYFGERGGRLSLLVAGGEEVDNLGQGLVVSDVRSVALGARWPLPAGWALLGELLDHRQGDLYRRRGGRLAVARDF